MQCCDRFCSGLPSVTSVRAQIRNSISCCFHMYSIKHTPHSHTTGRLNPNTRKVGKIVVCWRSQQAGVGGVFVIPLHLMSDVKCCLAKAPCSREAHALPAVLGRDTVMCTQSAVWSCILNGLTCIYRSTHDPPRDIGYCMCRWQLRMIPPADLLDLY